MDVDPVSSQEPAAETEEKWRAIAAEKKQKQLDSIPKEWLITPPPEDRINVLDVPSECGLLTSREMEITNEVDVAALLAKLASGEWSSVEVTTAFYKRAVIAHQVVNCLTEIFVERALARAAELDEYLKTNGKPIGPLHGLPISLKDQFTMKGLETVMGWVSWIGKVSESDCVLVELLYQCGAVPFVRTNVPQTLFWGETHNSVFGRTLNPHNRNLTPGGSSGGEGALIAMRGSPLGVGTDIGGSVRIPAAFCNIYSLRPSYERLPYQGARNTGEGQESISSTIGPMSNSLSGIKVFVKAILDMKPWLKDPLVPKMPWNEPAYQLVEHGNGVGLCFGFMVDDGLFKPQPPLYRAMEMTKKALIAAGHTVIEWEPKKHLEIFINCNSIYFADDGENLRRECEATDEPLLQTMHPEELLVELDDASMPYERHVVRDLGHLTTYELWELHKEKRQLRKEYLDHWMGTVERTGTGRPVDAIICPAAPYPAPLHGHNRNAWYTTIWNALDYTVAVLPVTYVDPKLDVQHPPHKFRNHEDQWIYESYDPSSYEGCPIGLQVVGQRQEEEAVIAIAEIVERALKASPS
ncbi:hypothetical protein BOTBODRAFT_119464 [Botryobasidium botryosum FD-172 SS1]|uniref:amidase n=1 Tax=Botryobasidium botryosum (strain FD-172 SS1) TaxID=930990 RepID=A0A067M7Q7_BOTB1|nr:hypothetical protein BOTBODRAFT_119464 [Botryobasidium botryosum FD-172 SS1]